MKLSQLLVEIIEEADAATLQTSVNAFLAAGGERVLIGPVQIQVYDTRYVAVINYTDN